MKAVLDGTFNCPDNTTEVTTYFLAACKYNIGIASIQNQEDNSTKYYNTRKLWNSRKEKQELMANI